MAVRARASPAIAISNCNNTLLIFVSAVAAIVRWASEPVETSNLPTIDGFGEPSY